MEWFCFFKDGMPQMVRYAATKGYAIEEVECFYGHRWTEFVALGFTCVREADVHPEEWDRICAIYRQEKELDDKERRRRDQQQLWEQTKKDFEERNAIKDKEFFRGPIPGGVSLETSRYVIWES